MEGCLKEARARVARLAQEREHPKAYLMDGGFATREDVTTLERRGVTVYAPVRLPRNKPGAERYQPDTRIARR